MDEADWELLHGMRNCYATCGEDFENTVRMVARARGLNPSHVKERLVRISGEVADTPEYQVLRAQLPKEFPF